MNMQTQIATPQAHSVGLLNLESFELSQRIAKMLSSSTLVPEQYRAVLKVKVGKDNFGNMQYRDEENPNGLSNCIIALNMANRMNADPLMVMQNLYLIEGRPAWSSQFIMAAINSCGRFSALRFDLQDMGEIEVEYQETNWVNRQKQTITKKITVKNLTCVAWAIERETGERIESSKITMEMAVKEGWYQKNGSKWQTMPEQMLRYRAASFFGRVYAPELLMGLRSAEEEQDRIIDVTPDNSVVSTQQDLAPIKKQILQAKTLDELDALAAEIEQYSDKEKAELDKLLNAQYRKYSEEATAKKPEPKNVVEEKPKRATKSKFDKYKAQVNACNTEEESAKLHDAIFYDDALSIEQQEELCGQLKFFMQRLSQQKSENVQNETSNDVVEKTSEADSVQSSGKSEDKRKFWIIQLNKAVSVKELNQCHEVILVDKMLTDTHRNYLLQMFNQLKEKMEQAAEQASKTQEAPAVDAIKSQAVKNGLQRMVTDAQTLEDLEKKVAPAIRENKPKMTTDHMAEVLNDYAARKKFLEDQQDMFAGVDESITYVDAVIKRIEAARSQDDINAEFMDPAFEDLSDQDKQRITMAAQKREAELMG